VALVLEKMAEAPTLTGLAGANASLRTDGSRVNEVEPQPEDTPGRAYPGRPHWMLYHLFLGPSILWTWEMGSRGDMLTGCDRVSTTKGDTDDGWSGCSASSPGLS
jgi:hypothetical protein